MQSLFADILSVLAMTYSDTEPRGTLRYRLLSASLLPPTSKISEPGSWGHEYVRHLAAELGEEYTIRQEGEEAVPLPAPEADSDAPKSKPAPVSGTIEDLHNLGSECATFFLGHNAEPDAVDLFVELEIVDRIASLVDANTFGRVCAYMDRYIYLFFHIPISQVSFADVSRSSHLLTMSLSCARYIRSISNSPNSPKLSASRSALMTLHSFDKTLTPLVTRKSHHVHIDIHSYLFRVMKKQLAFLLARAQIPIEWLKASASEDADAEDEFPEDIQDCLSNTQLSRHFKEFGKEVGVADPKSLEDVYKSHLETTSTFHYLKSCLSF